MFDCESTTSPPPALRKQQRIGDGFARQDAQCKESTMSAQSTKYMSPLDLLKIDKQKQVAEQRIIVYLKEKEVERLTDSYLKHPGIDYARPACTNCHTEKGGTQQT